MSGPPAFSSSADFSR